MKRVVNSSEVPHLWAHQTQDGARTPNGNLYFEGKTIYSYGAHFPIATFVSNADGRTAVLFTTRTYSITTAGHCSTVRQAIQHLSPVFHVPLTNLLCRYGNDGSVQSLVADNKAALLTDYLARIERLSAEVARAKAHRDWKFAELTKLVAEANEFCTFFAIDPTVEQHRDGLVTRVPRFAVPQDFEALRANLAQAAAQKSAAARERKREIAERNTENIAEWCAGGNVSLSYEIDTVYLRIEGAEVVTSKGASWVIVDRKTNKAVLETYNPKVVRAINKAKYTVVPILQYLGDLNRAIKANGGIQP